VNKLLGQENHWWLSGNSREILIPEKEGDNRVSGGEGDRKHRERKTRRESPETQDFGPKKGPATCAVPWVELERVQRRAGEMNKSSVKHSLKVCKA